MGIQGLLPLLKEISTPIHIKQWKGKTVAVDAYVGHLFPRLYQPAQRSADEAKLQVWLHRGAYGCAEELATGTLTVK